MIKHLPACAVFSVLACSAAHAAPGVDSQLFSAAFTSGDGSRQMTLLTDTGTEVRLALSGVGADDPYGERFSGQSRAGMSDSSDNEQTFLWNYWDSYVSFNVAQGYRVKSFTLSGTLTGSLSPASVPADTLPRDFGANGVARTHSSWSLATSNGGDSITAARQDNLLGTQAFSMTYESEATGAFTLFLSNDITMSLWSAYRAVEANGLQSYEYFPSEASLDTANVVLTIQLAPVPEPDTYAMVLGGLALIACVARRRRQ
ncbi:PEP-CTERM sorting domain-containing protein [Massilia sp. YMA4]|uniref:PEP-CTERM sorting domain-containing protein n=1 Tax=Massilia sp. YMA4 TaxID=1593482 RepID=UPI000DD159FE|nr:PEP-CTERM sorting domain-containing protein [Massilia sp. YMA4]AXA91455.1 hypothetical protein DPH57_10020 [Massilia sp. YMA4]